MSKKNYDNHNRWRNKTVAFRVSAEEDLQLETLVKLTGLTKLIIVDTLQKVREAVSDSYSYSSDYEVIGKLKQFADRYGVCVLIVHHTRKQPAGDIPTWMCWWPSPARWRTTGRPTPRRS